MSAPGGRRHHPAAGARALSRRLILAVLSVVAFLTAAGPALGHAELSASSPAVDSRVAVSPDRVVLTFTEPVQLLAPDDVEVLDSKGASVGAAPAKVQPDDARTVAVPLRRNLPSGTYTVRSQIIGADSHIIPGVFVFGVGNGELEAPFSNASVSTGPSETSPWGVSARFVQLLGLGGLVGLLAFRWLVWAPAARRTASVGPEEGQAVLSWGRDLFWFGFGLLAFLAMVAEGYVLVVQSASALGVGVLAAAQDANGISLVLAETRFGSLVQVRGALLFGVFALGAVQFMREYAAVDGSPKPAPPAAGRIPAVIMAALLLAALGGIAAQGHANVSSLAPVQIGAQLTHIATVAIWISGLALVAIALLRVPRIDPEAGPALAANLLARFSKVALVVVAAAIVTGVVRSIAELSDPAELWETGYGRSILIKLALLCPIAALAFYNRRILVALQGIQRPSRTTLSLVRRTAVVELGLTTAIVVVASLLVAQVPGAS